MNKLLADLNQRGWTVTDLNTEKSLDEFAHNFGTVFSPYNNSPLVQKLKVNDTEDSHDFSLSGNYGRGSFPFHTDLAHHKKPPHYIILRSISSTKNIRPTLILDSFSFIKNEKLQDGLKKILWIVNGGNGKFYSPLLNDKTLNGKTFFRYDPVCMKPISSKKDLANSLLNSCIEKAKEITINWHPGKTLIIDNWRILHARAGAEEKFDDEQRIIERCVIK